MMPSDHCRGPSNFIRVQYLRRHATLLAILCFVWVAEAARPYTGKLASANCLNPVTGRGGKFDLQRTLQFSKQYLKMHQIADAIPCLERAHAMDPTGDSAGSVVIYDLGLAYLQTGATDAARVLVEKQLKSQDRAEFHDLLGAIETKRQHFHAASTQYQIAAQMDPSEQNIFDFATSLSRFQGSSAEKIFRYGIAKYPGSVKLHVGLGSALYAQGQSTEAAQEMCAAARLDPADPHPMEMIGETQQIPPDLAAEITSHFADLVHRYPQNARLLYDYAMSLSGIWSGQTFPNAGAEVLLQRVLALDPHLARAYFSLAQIEERKKQYAEAVENYRKAADLSLTNDQYLYRLAFAYKEAGNVRMFQKELQQFRVIHERRKKSE